MADEDDVKQSFTGDPSAEEDFAPSGEMLEAQDGDQEDITDPLSQGNAEGAVKKEEAVGQNEPIDQQAEMAPSADDVSDQEVNSDAPPAEIKEANLGEPGEAAEALEAAELDEAKSDGESAEEDADGEETVDADLPPAGPPGPEEPKSDCPTCPPTGAPAWMATFADMATLLMAFFVLLLSFAETEVPKFKQVAGSLKAAFGIEKIVPKIVIPSARSIMVENFTPAVAERSVFDEKTQRSDFVRGDFIEKKTEEGEFNEELQSDFQQVQEALEQELNNGTADVRIQDGEVKVTLLEPNSAGGSVGSEGDGAGGPVAQETIDAVAKVADVSANLSSTVGIHLTDKARGQDIGGNADSKRLRSNASSGISKYEQLKADLSQEIAAGLAEVEKVGDKIIVRLASQGSFTSGSARLRDSFSPTLGRLGNSLARYPGGVMIEGHTDNVPVAFSEQFKSNWDLSAARAAAVADFLLTATNLEGGNVQIAGFADTRPLDTNDSPSGRSRNRRIEVIVDDN